MEDHVRISTEYIKLDQFIKWTGIAYSGAEAKDIVLSEDVFVNGELEKRRGRKLRKGDSVKVLGRSFIIE